MHDQMHDPLERLAADRGQAYAAKDPNAGICTLANVDDAGQPQARTLVLRDLDGRLAIFVNATSPKYQSLTAGPLSALVWLPSQNVQYRMACTTEPVPHDIVHDSWHLRPDPPKRMDWLYTRVQAQSTAVADRTQLLSALEALDLPDPLTAPETARGLYLCTDQVERLDLGQTNGVHDRILYRHNGTTWVAEVLVP